MLDFDVDRVLHMKSINLAGVCVAWKICQMLDSRVRLDSFCYTVFSIVLCKSKREQPAVYT